MENQWINEMSMLDILKHFLVGKRITIYSTLSGYSVIKYDDSISHIVEVINIEKDYEGMTIIVKRNDSAILNLHTFLSCPLQIIGN